MPTAVQSTENDYHGNEIAIIGLAGRFPGATSIDQFWHNLQNGQESLTVFGDEDLLKLGVTRDMLNQPNYIRTRGVMADYDRFDAAFFGYTPAEAELMDPQMRLLHECVWHALEDAGYDPFRYRQPIGLFSAASQHFAWEALSFFGGQASPAELFEAEKLGQKDYSATRIAYKLNLRGPCLQLFSACSSSLVAVHQACQALLAGECDLALAGGVSLVVTQLQGYLAQAGMIESPTGHVRAFDAEADGTVGGSGVGLVVLKLLTDARRDRDQIYAVIKGSAINNDGNRKVGYSAPSIPGQVEVIRAALQAAEVSPATLGYIEAHGTGTPIGDPIELRALQTVLAEAEPGSCPIGSVKTNIGHLDSAAGIAGLIKTTLCLYHQQIPPSLNCQQPSPQIDWTKSPCFVNTSLRDWPPGSGPRRAGVSSFGIGGTNAHLILEEAPPIEEAPSLAVDRPSWKTAPALSHEENVPSEPVWQILPLSARSQSALRDVTSNLVRLMERQPGLDLADVAYTLQLGRRAQPLRKFLLARDSKSAVNDLTSPVSGQVLSGLTGPEKPSVIFLFPGQGSHYPAMGRELYASEPMFRQEIDRGGAILKALSPIDFRAILLAQPLEMAATSLARTDIAQPLLFLLEIALAKLLMSWGIKPAAMIGHSLGEYVAACLAGVFSFEDGLALVARRGQLMHAGPNGAMLSVSLAESDVLAQLPPELEIAAINAPAVTVVTGEASLIDDFARLLARQGIATQRLHTSQAFHSRLMAPVQAEFSTVMSQITLKPPQIPYISNVSGHWIQADEATDPSYYGRHLRQPVKFSAGVRELAQFATPLFLEVGPGQTLAGLIRQHQTGSEHGPVISIMKHPREEVAEQYRLYQGVGRLWLAGVEPDWAEFQKNCPGRRIALPGYPFERQRYWRLVEEYIANRGFLAAGTSGEVRPLSEWFSVATWKRLPLLAKMPLPGPGSVCLLFQQDSALAKAISARLAAARVTTIAIEAGPDFQQSAAGHYRIDPEKADHIERLLLSLKERRITPVSSIYLWTLPPARRRSTPAARYRLSQTFGLYFLGDLAKLWGRCYGEAPLALTIVSSGLANVTGAEWIEPDAALSLGASQVIPLEFSAIQCRQIDIERLSPENSRHIEHTAESILAETFSAVLAPLVAYRQGGRWLPHYERLTPIAPGAPGESAPYERLTPTGPEAGNESAPGSAPEAQTPPASTPLYLISGGLGGIGFTIGCYLAKTYAARLIIIGQTELPPAQEWRVILATQPDSPLARKITRLQTLQRLSPKVHYCPLDIAATKKVRAALQRIEQSEGEIRGIVHAAGTPDGALIVRRTRADSERVLRAKVGGLITLQSIFSARRLDFFWLCSSLNSIIPQAGQLAYVAANAYLDAFAQQAAGAGQTGVKSINWQAWQKVGMAAEGVAQLPAGLRSNRAKFLQQAGIDPERIGEIMPYLWHLPTPQILVSPRDIAWEMRQQQQSATLAALVESEVDAPPAISPRPNLATPYLPPVSDLEIALAQLLSELFGFSQIGLLDDFFELGGDSLKAIRFLAQIKRLFASDITLNDFFSKPTVQQLARTIVASQEMKKITFDAHYVEFNPTAGQPLFCFPPYVCYGLAYYELSKLLPNQRLYCFNFIDQPNRIEAYIEIITHLQPQPPYRIFAYSAGGRLAFEVVKVMNARGLLVSDLILLDSFARWKPLEIFSREEETTRSNKLLSQFDYLFAGNEEMKAAAIENLVAYARLIQEITITGQIESTIHFIRAEAEVAENDENRDWYRYSVNNSWRAHSRKYREYQGFGPHMVMLMLEFLGQNGGLIRGILEAGRG